LAKEALAKATDDDELSESLEGDYDHPEAAAGTAEGDRCEREAAATPEEGELDRVPCDEGLCCGSADKFLRDGSKMTIETC